MGYSPPKKQLDLKEFLSQPAKKLPKRGFGYRRMLNKSVQSTDSDVQKGEKEGE